MLDPFTALSVASAVIQFVDFGCKLTSQTQEMYHSASGASKTNVTIEEITEDIRSLTQNLVKKSNSIQFPSLDDIALGKLVQLCQQEAEELLRVLVGLRVLPGAVTKWVSFRKAIKSVRQKERIGEIEARLRKIQKQIDSRIQFMMRYVFAGLLKMAH